MTKTTRVAAVAAMAAFCAPGVTEAGASQAQPAVAAASPPQEIARGDPAFYTVPDPIPAGDHGDPIRFQVVDSAFTHRYRIMYLSQAMAGAPTVVTALVEVDEAPTATTPASSSRSATPPTPPGRSPCRRRS